jgi:hypothetical protein
MCPTSIEESVALCFLQVSSLLFLREMWHFPRAQHFWGKCGTFLGLSTLRKMWHFPAPQHFPTGSSLLFFLRVRVKGLGSGCRFRRCYVSSLLWSQRLRRPSLCLYLLMSLSVFLPISIYAYTCLFLPMPIYAYNLSLPISAYVYLFLPISVYAFICLFLSMPIYASVPEGCRPFLEWANPCYKHVHPHELTQTHSHTYKSHVRRACTHAIKHATCNHIDVCVHKSKKYWHKLLMNVHRCCQCWRRGVDWS